MTTSASRPNVVVVVADDLGYGDLGLFNGGRCNSPYLDALAVSGVCLTQHYSGSPVCAPARASLLTGRYPHRTGAIDTLQGRGLDRIALSETTLADLFRAAGYATGLVGKWHNGALDPRYHPNARGFDEFAGFSGGFSDYYDYSLDVNGTEVEGDGRYLTDVLTDHAVAFVRRHSRSPFFLMVAYNAPHFPMQAPQELVDGYLARGETLGAALTYAMIEVMDAGVGRIDETLHELGLAENTLVLFTSDNGPTSARSTASASTASTTASGARSTTSSKAASGCRRSCAGPTGWPAGGSCRRCSTSPTGCRRSRRWPAFPRRARTGSTAATSAMC